MPLPKIECFFQVLICIEGLYSLGIVPEPILNYIQENLKLLSLYFTENNASISGSTIYGGLLDRCAVSQFTEVRIKYAEDYETGGNGIQYLKHVSTITESGLSISSQLVKVCLCIDNKHNCTLQKRIEVKKGVATIQYIPCFHRYRSNKPTSQWTNSYLIQLCRECCSYGSRYKRNTC